MFIADNIMRGFMDDFGDTLQTNGSIESIEEMTKIFRLEFVDETDTYSDEITIVALHSSRQFGEDINMSEVYGNENNTYYGYEGKPVYMYIYNYDEDNEIGITPGETGQEYALDYDDEEFADTDDELFTIYVT